MTPQVYGAKTLAARAGSSVGRASALHADGRRFESCPAHLLLLATLGLTACQPESTGKRIDVVGEQRFDLNVSKSDDSAVDPPVDAAVPEPDVPLVVDPADRVVLATYNVYNFFDLVDDPRIDEDPFTPRPGVWDAAKLAERMRLTSAVFEHLNADVVMVNEIENRETLEALRDAIAAHGGPEYPYIAHVEGRGGRGIDVGLLSRFRVVREVSRPISWPHRCQGEDGEVELDGSMPEARPMLQADIDLDGDRVADLVVLGHHWKAKGRSWPCEDDEHRLRSGLQLRDVFETLMAEGQSVVAMGDFNAHEFEPPLRDAVQAKLDLGSVGPGDVYNTWGGADGVEEGRNSNSNRWNNRDNSSYNFFDEWTRLDHILVSGDMRPGGEARWQVIPGSVRTAFFDAMLDRDGEPKEWRANRAGYSDHLPVRVDLRYAE